MTLEQLAELHGLHVDTIKYRRRHGIPLDHPKGAAWRKKGRPKGTPLVKRCGCAIRWPCLH